MVWIIITSVVLGISVIAFFIFLIKMILEIINKNKDKIKKNIVLMSSALLAVVVLAIADSIVIGSYVYQNKDKIIDETAKVSGTTLAKTLRYTADDLWKNWDNEFVAQLSNIDLEIKNYQITKKNKEISYDFEIIFNNKNTNNASISFRKVLSDNYLMAGDANEIYYSLNVIKKSFKFDIPKGKSTATVQAVLTEDTEPVFLKFANNKIKIEKK